MIKRSFLLFFIVAVSINLSAQNRVITTKTERFKKLDYDQAFKGVKFGSSPTRIGDLLNLKKPKPYYGHYHIMNKDYLKFGYFQFTSGTALFTDISNKLYCVRLKMNDNFPNLITYNKIKKELIAVFGPNDSQISDDTYSGTGWQGKYIDISLNIRKSDNSNIGEIHLTINHYSLNALSHDELYDKGIPKY